MAQYYKSKEKIKKPLLIKTNAVALNNAFPNQIVEPSLKSSLNPAFSFNIQSNLNEFIFEFNNLNFF